MLCLIFLLFYPKNWIILLSFDLLFVGVCKGGDRNNLIIISRGSYLSTSREGKKK